MEQEKQKKPKKKISIVLAWHYFRLIYRSVLFIQSSVTKRLKEIKNLSFIQKRRIKKINKSYTIKSEYEWTERTVE